MIEEISLKNILSFKNEVTFSFEATDDTTFESSHVVTMPDGTRLLRLGIVYGANASGKTNLLNAIDWLRSFWLFNPQDVNKRTGIEPFLLDVDTPHQPSEFNIKFWVNGIKYAYRLFVTNEYVIYEALSYYNIEQPVKVFERELIDGQSVLHFNADVQEIDKEKKQEELESMGEKDAFKKNLEDKKKQLEELKEAISKQASQAGTSTNRDVRIVNDIGTAKPIVDWRYVLREAIKYDVDWSYKNATLEDGVVTANLEEQPMPETEIVLDTSGSINEVLLKNFLRECKNILQHTKLKVGCFDTEFYGFHEIRTEEDIENMRFEGGGGTDFDVAVGAFSRRVENKIIFTDGEASMPDMPLDAIWIVFGGERINPKGGKVIHITPEQLDRLYSYEMNIESKGKTR